MYIQHCIKGIAAASPSGSIMNKDDAFEMANLIGIISNWWRNNVLITNAEIASVLTESNLDRHIHDYDNYQNETPFISLASGSVERDTLYSRNSLYSAIDTALSFATKDWLCPGALFYLWVPVSHQPAVALSGVAEPVRDLNIYHRWSDYQLEGEITAKIGIPSNQIRKVEWWDGNSSRDKPIQTFVNPNYVDPALIGNIRDWF